MPGENVLVTGASSGIGLELAKRFAESGSDLILVARSADKLERLAQAFQTEYGVQARALPQDLSDPAAPQALYEMLQAEDVPVHVLVNNAGFAARGRFAELSIERQMDMIQVNVAALTRLTHLFLPEMMKRGRGGILNVASTAAFQPGPHMAVYYASKAYVLSFTEGLAEELRGTGVTATCLAPGPTATTGFQAEVDADTLIIRVSGLMSAEAVARAGYGGFRKGRVLVVPGLQHKAWTAVAHLIPRALVRRTIHFLQR